MQRWLVIITCALFIRRFWKRAVWEALTCGVGMEVAAVVGVRGVTVGICVDVNAAGATVLEGVEGAECGSALEVSSWWWETVFVVLEGSTDIGATVGGSVSIMSTLKCRLLVGNN